MKDDLVLRQLEEGIFSVLKDGKQIAEYLRKLTDEHNYSIVLYSNRKEHHIIHTLLEFDEACKREGLKSFPKIAALVVKDRESYSQVKPSKLKVVESRSYEILIAGYGIQPQQETEILNGISKLVILTEFDQRSCFVIDNRLSFIKKASQEGWRVYDGSLTSLKGFLWELCQQTHSLSIIQERQNYPDIQKRKIYPEDSDVVLWDLCRGERPRPIVVDRQRHSEDSDADIEEDLMDDKPKISLIPKFETHKFSQSPNKSPGKQSQQNLKTEYQSPGKTENREKAKIFSGFSHPTNPSPIKNVIGLRIGKKEILPNDTQTANVFESQDVSSQDNDGFQPHDYHYGVEELLKVVINKRPSRDVRRIDTPLLSPVSEIYEDICLDKIYRKNVREYESNDEERLATLHQQPRQEKAKGTAESVTYQENSSPEKPFISELVFEPLNKPSPRGSSFTRWFTEKESKTEWIGKHYSLAAQEEFDEYKEYLASQLYEFFGVKVPKTVLSKQYLAEIAQQT